MWLSKVLISLFIFLSVLFASEDGLIDTKTCPVKKMDLLTKIEKNSYVEKNWNGKGNYISLTVGKRTSEAELSIKRARKNTGLKLTLEQEYKGYARYIGKFNEPSDISMHIVYTDDFIITYNGFSPSEIDTIISRCLPKNQTK